MKKKRAARTINTPQKRRRINRNKEEEEEEKSESLKISNTPAPKIVPSNTTLIRPTNTPTNSPSIRPTNTPTNSPSIRPTNMTSITHSIRPSNTSSIRPSNTPSNTSSIRPTNTTSNTPSNTPSNTSLNTSLNAPNNTPSITSDTNSISVETSGIQALNAKFDLLLEAIQKQTLVMDRKMKNGTHQKVIDVDEEEEDVPEITVFVSGQDVTSHLITSIEEKFMGSYWAVNDTWANWSDEKKMTSLKAFCSTIPKIKKGKEKYNLNNAVPLFILFFAIEKGGGYLDKGIIIFMDYFSSKWGDRKRIRSTINDSCLVPNDQNIKSKKRIFSEKACDILGNWFKNHFGVNQELVKKIYQIHLENSKTVSFWKSFELIESAFGEPLTFDYSDFNTFFDKLDDGWEFVRLAAMELKVDIHGLDDLKCIKWLLVEAFKKNKKNS